MTHFKGPVRVGAGTGVPNQGAIAYVDINTSGTSRFATQLVVGPTSADATNYIQVDASGTALFSGGLLLEGASNAAGRSSIVHVVSVAGTALNAAAGTNVRFPANSILTDAQFILRVPVSATATAAGNAANIWVGASGNEGSYLRIPVSASGMHGIVRTGGTQVCATNMFNTGSTATEIYMSVNVQATGANADASTLEGLLLLHFSRRA